LELAGAPTLAAPAMLLGSAPTFHRAELPRMFNQFMRDFPMRPAIYPAQIGERPLAT